MYVRRYIGVELAVAMQAQPCVYLSLPFCTFVMAILKSSCTETGAYGGGGDNTYRGCKHKKLERPGDSCRGKEGLWQVLIN